MTVTWERALTECEALLDAAEAALDDGHPLAIAPFGSPEVEGTLPSELAGRARVCSARSEEVAQRLSDELERIRLELRRLPRMPRAASENRFEAQA
ncbi:MAG TPA: hypothetical protein VGP92_15610 [Acidimicrobiia bacterium]|jgi:hypothetical protein|nr:hypothetical protein [Acidimicrobiia bacterium]